MSFSSDKLETTFISPMTPDGPVENRKYTLTHSDETGMMFLDIGSQYNYSAINEDMRDEILGKWIMSDDNFYRLIFYAHVGDYNFTNAYKRYMIFKSHLESALQAVFFGDKDLFESYPQLIYTPIYAKFDSTIPMFNNYEYYGYIKDYII